MKPKSGSILLIVFGSLLSLGPVWGMVVTVICMVRAFFEIGKPGATSDQLATNISHGLWASFVGGIICPIGIAMLVGGIMWFNRSKKSVAHA